MTIFTIIKKLFAIAPVKLQLLNWPGSSLASPNSVRDNPAAAPNRSASTQDHFSATHTSVRANPTLAAKAPIKDLLSSKRDNLRPRRRSPVPEQHARELLAWLRTNCNKFDVQHAEILAQYQQMCGEKGLNPRPWAPIARAFALLTTGGRKIYQEYERDGDGEFARRRVYPFRPQSSLTAQEGRQQAAEIDSQLTDNSK
ncbi:MAG: hypothetical protein ACKVP4_10620 [Hyphomicrobium sp.]